MSATLPEDAHVEAAAAPSVEDQAPASTDAVAEDSVGNGGNVVPADRFNGLMGRFNRTQNELEAARAQIAELEARLSGSEPTQENKPPVSDNSALEAQVQQLQQMLLEERMESARDKALKEFPEAAPFADLIVADTPADVREMARLIAERAKAASPGTPPPTQAVEAEEVPASAEAVPEAPVVEPPVAGGGAAFSSEASAEDRVGTAIQKGSFSDFINAKWEQRALQDGADLNLG